MDALGGGGGGARPVGLTQFQYVVEAEHAYLGEKLLLLEQNAQQE